MPQTPSLSINIDQSKAHADAGDRPCQTTYHYDGLLPSGPISSKMSWMCWMPITTATIVSSIRFGCRCATVSEKSEILFWFLFKIRSSRSDMWTLKWPHLHFAPWFKLFSSQNQRDTLTLYWPIISSFILSAIQIRKCSFSVAQVSLKAVIEDVSICVSICVSLSLSSRATSAPLFDEQNSSSREYFSRLYGLSRSRFRIGVYLMSSSFRDSRWSLSIPKERFGCTMPRKLKWILII